MYVGSCLDRSGDSWTNFGGCARRDQWLARRVSTVLMILTATSFWWWIFDCPLTFRHKKGFTFLSTCRCFCFQGEIFLSLEPVEIRLYLGASLCIYLFGSWCILVGIIILGGVTFIVSYVSCFTVCWLIFMMLFIDICLYFMFCEFKNLFCLLVFSIHVFMHLV